MVLSVRSFRFPVCVVGRGAFCHVFYLDSSVETLVVPSLRTLEELRAVRCFRLPCRVWDSIGSISTLFSVSGEGVVLGLVGGSSFFVQSWSLDGVSVRVVVPDSVSSVFIQRCFWSCSPMRM